MPHRPKGSDWWKTRITLPDGRTGVFACGTTNPEVAEDVERMVKTLRHDRMFAPLTLIFENRAKLGDTYDAFKAGALDQFLRAQSAPDLSRLVTEWPAKTAKYKTQVRCMIPADAPFPATDFTKARIAGFLDSLTWSGSTKNRYHAALSAFGKWLSRKDLIPTNIVRDVDRATPNRVEPRYLDRVQAKALIGALPMPNRALEALMASFGAEWQVIERLTRRDVDLKKRTVHARGGKTPWRNRVARPTERWAWNIFAEYARNFTDNAPLFPGIREDTALRVHKAASKAVGLPHTTLHDWRHTYAVQARRDGYSDPIIAHNEGHKDTTLIATRYGKHTPRPEDFVRRHARKPPSSRASRRGKRSSTRTA